VEYEEFPLQLQPGDSVLFCSDGLTEARNLHDQFGLAGIQDVCRRFSGDIPLDLLAHIFSAIEEFTADCRQWDDMTATVFHCFPTSTLSFG
jgi:serine phosphatase RsbU (regulator of sigma subunit)